MISIINSSGLGGKLEYRETLTGFSKLSDLLNTQSRVVRYGTSCMVLPGDCHSRRRIRTSKERSYKDSILWRNATIFDICKVSLGHISV